MQSQIENLYKPLSLYIRKRVNNQSDAEDLTQEVFYKLAKSEMDGIQNVRSWLYAIAKNTLTDYYRTKKISVEDLDKVEVESEIISCDTVSELSNCIKPFVNQLPEELKSIMTLSELEGIQQKKIAEQLNINYVTLRSKIQRGRKRLKQMISECCVVTQGHKGSILDFRPRNGCDSDCQ